MNFAPEFLALVSNSDVCSSYYALCREHPLRLDVPLAKAPWKDILQAAAGRVPLTRLRDPGRVFQLGGLPHDVSLNFIIQGGGTVETDLVVPWRGTPQRGTFAILCNQATGYSGNPLPDPPYPRPEFHSLDELLIVVQRFDTLIRKLAFVASERH